VLLREQDRCEFARSIVQFVGRTVAASTAAVVVVGRPGHSVHRLDHFQGVCRSLGHDRPLLGRSQHDEAPALRVRARGSPPGRFEAPSGGDVVDRLVGEAPDRPGGRHHFPDVTACSRYRRSSSRAPDIWTAPETDSDRAGLRRAAVVRCTSGHDTCRGRPACRRHRGTRCIAAAVVMTGPCRKVMIQVRGTSAGKSLRSTRSLITRADSGYRRDSAYLRCSRDIALQNASRAAVLGIVAILSIRGPIRANGASGPPRVSTTDSPCGGMNAAANTISRTLVAPSLATTPGTVSPPSECPTMTRSLSIASSTSATTEFTQSAIVTVARSAGLRPRPGRSTASTRNFGSWQTNSEMVQSQQSAACAPP
jgi:hypothetical protein